MYVEEPDQYKRKRFVMLYRAIYDGEVHPNPEEVAAVRWIKPEALKTEIQKHPEQFTLGFQMAFAEI